MTDQTRHDDFEDDTDFEDDDELEDDAEYEVEDDAEYEVEVDDKVDDDDQEAEPWDLLSDALGSLDQLESDDEYALDIREQGQGQNQVERFTKVPLEHASNLLTIRSLADGIKSGSITVEVYRFRLRQMVRALEEGLKVFKSDAVAKHVEALPEDQKVYAVETGRLVEMLVEGGQTMLRYAESKNFGDVEQGLQTIESAYERLDELQTRAIEIGREMAVREAATGEPDRPIPKL